MEDLALFVERSAAIALRESRAPALSLPKVERSEREELVAAFAPVRELGEAIKGHEADAAVVAALNESYQQFVGRSLEIGSEILALQAEGRRQRELFESQRQVMVSPSPSFEAEEFYFSKLPISAMRITLEEAALSMPELQYVQSVAETSRDARLAEAVNKAMRWAAHRLLLGRQLQRWVDRRADIILRLEES